MTNDVSTENTLILEEIHIRTVQMLREPHKGYGREVIETKIN